MTLRDQEQLAPLTKFNGAPNAHRCLRVIDRCLREKQKRKSARFGFSLKAHQCARARAATTKWVASCRHIGPRVSRDNAFGANVGASSLNAGTCRMPRTPGSGNIRWRVSTFRSRFKRGRPGFRKCSAVKRDGEPCGNLSMRHVSVCQCHGGRMLVARLRFQQKAYRRRFTFS
jgi:hypothetical protein